MAGIGFVLRRVVRRDSLGAQLAGLAHAGVVSSGPWLLTCFALALIAALGGAATDKVALVRFSILIGYNFSFSLVATGPVVVVVLRGVADRIHARDVSEVPAMLLGALVLVFGVAGGVGALLYGFVVDLTAAERLLGFAGLLLASGLWLATAFIAALKSYASISAAFAAGMAVGAALAVALVGRFGTTGLLLGFDAGLAVVLFALVARVFAEFPSGIVRPSAFLEGFRRYPELVVFGLLYNTAIWVDKWIFWFAPGLITPAAGLRSHPAYEGAMFFAYLSVVPAMALFVIELETRFYERYRCFYRDIANHATLAEIRRNQARLVDVLLSGGRRVAVLQAVVCLGAMLVAPVLIRAAGGGLEMVPVFRYGLVGASLHLLLALALTVLAYFDLRRDLVVVAAVFLVLQAGFALATVALGTEYHGAGYALASLLALAFALCLSIRRVAQLPYLTFVANNPALRKGADAAPPVRDVVHGKADGVAASM